MTDAPAARDALSFLELMAYTGEETDRWEAWLRAHDPAVLDLPLGGGAQDDIIRVGAEGRPPQVIEVAASRSCGHCSWPAWRSAVATCAQWRMPCSSACATIFRREPYIGP